MASKASTGYIDENGVYRRGERRSLGHDMNATYKEWHHDLERKQFSKEIIQPHVGNKPNPKFVKAYRDDPILKEYFSQDEIDRVEREAL